MPLYHQIFLQLRDEIVSGQRPYGTALPTEEVLSQQFGVSRITARRVLGELANQNFAERKRRVGTTVIFHTPVKPIEASIDNALDSLLTLGRSTQVQVLEVATEYASFAVTDALKLAPGSPVVRAIRLRLLDTLPIGHVLSYVPASLAPFITREALVAKPMLELLEQAGHKAHRAEQTISAMLADTSLANALAIEPRAPLLSITRTVHDQSGTPVLLTFAHYRSDRFHIRLDLSSPAPENAPGEARGLASVST